MHLQSVTEDPLPRRYRPRREFLKHVLRRLGLLRLTYSLMERIRPSDRKRLNQTKQMTARLEHEIASVFPLPDTYLPERSRSVVIVCRMPDPRWITYQSLAITAFRLSGYRPKVLMFEKNRVAEDFYRKIGAEGFLFFHDFSGYGDRGAVGRILRTAAGMGELLDSQYEGISIGTYAIARLMRRHHLSEVDLGDPSHREWLRRLLTETVAATQGAISLAETEESDAIYFVGDIGYPPQGPLVDAFIRAGSQPFLDIGGHRSNTLMMRRITPVNRREHGSSLSPETWARLQRIEWSEERWERLRIEIDKAYQQREWFSGTGTQFLARHQDPHQLRDELGLDADKKTAVIFPHIFWDAPFVFGTDLFPNYKEWFVATVEEACRNDRCNWVIKIHPSNRVKTVREGLVGEPAEIQSLRHLLPPPDHVRILPADTDVSTASLMGLLDYCITVRGTPGLEAAIRGKVVVTAGTGRYDGRGFTIDPRSTDDYLERIRHIQELERPDAKQVELARRFAYGIFIARPVPIDALNVTRIRDERANLSVGVKASDPRSFIESPDIQTVKAWIDSGDIDLMNPIF